MTILANASIEAELTQLVSQVRGHLLAAYRVWHEDKANPVLLAQRLLQCVTLHLCFERRPALVHWIRALTMLHASEIADHLEFLTPSIQLQAPIC